MHFVYRTGEAYSEHFLLPYVSEFKPVNDGGIENVFSTKQEEGIS